MVTASRIQYVVQVRKNNNYFVTNKCFVISASRSSRGGAISTTLSTLIICRTEAAAIARFVFAASRSITNIQGRDQRTPSVNVVGSSGAVGLVMLTVGGTMVVKRSPPGGT